MIISTNTVNGVEIITAENDQILCKVAPALGGKITSLYNKSLDKEFLWSNAGLPLQILKPGADYDSNFWGGIDELIPNDIPETVDSIPYPDHGELWTTPLTHAFTDQQIIVKGILPLSGLYYERILSMDEALPVIHLRYRIVNQSGARRHFLWKMHAALKISAGDKLLTGALKGKVVDPQYSRFTNTEPFDWPVIEGIDASVVPVRDNTMDFFYLYNMPEGEMQMTNNADGSLFAYRYDKKVFPYQWYFASYGKFLDHYTAILEPCSCMLLSVNEAKQDQQCSILEPDQEINASVRIFAGEKINYVSHL